MSWIIKEKLNIYSLYGQRTTLNNQITGVQLAGYIALKAIWKLSVHLHIFNGKETFLMLWIDCINGPNYWPLTFMLFPLYIFVPFSIWLWIQSSDLLSPNRSKLDKSRGMKKQLVIYVSNLVFLRPQWEPWFPRNLRDKDVERSRDSQLR